MAADHRKSDVSRSWRVTTGGFLVAALGWLLVMLLVGGILLGPLLLGQWINRDWGAVIGMVIGVCLGLIAAPFAHMIQHSLRHWYWHKTNTGPNRDRFKRS